MLQTNSGQMLTDKWWNMSESIISDLYGDMAEYARECAVQENLKVMHLWLPSSATPEQINLVNKILEYDTGRDSKDTWRDVQ